MLLLNKYHLRRVPMRRALCLICALTLLHLASLTSAAEKGNDVPAVLNFTMKRLAGKEVPLAQYQGKVLLVVNTASECGLTPQYQALQGLHKKYAGQGLAVLGFPANEFGAQEPGTNEEIAAFCKANYGVEFDMFAKVVVQGSGQCPLYKHLTSKETNPRFGGPITWNFEKFLISRRGEVVARFAPDVEPNSDEVVRAIEAELARK
jgi:glutathione peroxidase